MINVLNSFRGKSIQEVPKYSAVKVNGKKGWVPASWIAPPKDTYTVMVNEVCNVDGTKIKFAGVENNVENNSCESAVDLVDISEESCVTQSLTEYYKITCKDNINTLFVPSKRNYYRGDDFNLDIKMTANVSCEGVFDHVKWQNAYNNGDSNTRNNLNQIKKI